VTTWLPFPTRSIGSVEGGLRVFLRLACQLPGQPYRRKKEIFPFVKQLANWPAGNPPTILCARWSGSNWQDWQRVDPRRSPIGSFGVSKWVRNPEPAGESVANGLDNFPDFFRSVNSTETRSGPAASIPETRTICDIWRDFIHFPAGFSRAQPVR
jgi:hypothetical protein